MSRLSFWIFLPAFLQLCILGTFDLGVDEAHYMLYARHLELSYFDHPPLVGWVHFVFNLVFGETLFSARLPAILAGIFSVWQLHLFLREQGFSEKAATVACLAQGFCFQFFVLHLFLLPDTLCLALVWPLLRAAVGTSEKPSTGAWLRLGLFLGLMGLAKYTAVFFVVPVAVLLLKRQGLSFFRKTDFYLAAGLALLIVSPVLIWNAQRDWLSFRYQGAHVLGESHGLQSFLKSLGLQIGIYSPFLWGFSVYGFFSLWRGRGRAATEFAFWSAAVFGGFFFYSSWNSVVLPHWSALFYLFTLPWGVAALFGRLPRLTKAAVGLTATVIVVLCGLLLTGQGYAIPGALKEVAGWPQVMPQALAKASEADGVAVLNWTYGSRARYYAGEQETKVFVLDQRQDQFDLWQKKNPSAQNLWILQFSFDEKDLGGIVQCDSLSEKESTAVYKRGFHVYDIILQKCSGAHVL